MADKLTWDEIKSCQIVERVTAADDTDPRVHDFQIRGYRAMDAAQKFRLIDDMWNTDRELALAGLRARHPDADEAEIQRLMAVLFLGSELAERIYGAAPRSGRSQR